MQLELINREQTMEKVFLVHGWSVTETSTYQALHLKLGQAGYDLSEVHLGRYVSLDDNVEIRDLAHAMHQALIDEMGPPPWGDRFHFITHSTGALVVREWILKHYTGQALKNRPVANAIFLAAPHFGSRLAHHGQSMLASIRYWGPTGRSLLRALELGSPFAWANNGDFGDPATLKEKAIRFFCITGDRVNRNPVASRVMPAGYETGSDMVVRVPAANMNFQRFHLDAANRELTATAGIEGVAFGALDQYVHSGPSRGIMNSITRRANPEKPKWLNLKLILDCLRVSSDRAYGSVRDELARLSSRRKRRGPFAQLVFRFRDQDGQPVDDYQFTLGQVVGGRDRAARCVADVHKNNSDRSYFVAFIDCSKIDRRYRYYLSFRGRTGSPLTRFEPDEFRVDLSRDQLKSVIQPDRTTEIEVVLPRLSEPELFRFHKGDDADLHVKWDREGEITRRKIDTK